MSDTSDLYIQKHFIASTVSVNTNKLYNQGLMYNKCLQGITHLKTTLVN